MSIVAEFTHNRIPWKACLEIIIHQIECKTVHHEDAIAAEREGGKVEPLDDMARSIARPSEVGQVKRSSPGAKGRISAEGTIRLKANGLVVEDLF